MGEGPDPEIEEQASEGSDEIIMEDMDQEFFGEDIPDLLDEDPSSSGDEVVDMTDPI